MENEKRIDELEMKFTLQDDLIFELNKIVTKQQFSIDKLVEKVKSLENQTSSQAGTERNLKDDIPPHY